MDSRSNEYQALQYQKHRDKRLVYQRQYRKEHLEDKLEYNRRRRKEHPEAHRAYMAVQYALSTGYLIKPLECENCHEECKLEGHHEDYNKPLEVNWLCEHCHKAIHH